MMASATLLATTSVSLGPSWRLRMSQASRQANAWEAWSRCMKVDPWRAEPRIWCKDGPTGDPARQKRAGLGRLPQQRPDSRERGHQPLEPSAPTRVRLGLSRNCTCRRGPGSKHRLCERCASARRFAPTAAFNAAKEREDLRAWKLPSQTRGRLLDESGANDSQPWQ